MKSLGLVLKNSLSSAIPLAEKVATWCKDNSVELFYERRTAEFLGLKSAGIARKELVKQAQNIVVLGGDGTLIGVARYSQVKSPLFIGVNFGNLGFLTELTPEELFPTLEKVLKDQVTSASRALLHASCYRGSDKIFESQAVNDVVIQKGTRSKLMELDVFINENDLMRIRGDGLIFSTPTGSTAYSLAAGGSIAYPTLDVTLLTPICPHSLSYRPIILPSEMELDVEVPRYEGEVFVTIDGQVSYQLSPGDRVHLQQAETRIRFARSSNEDYFSILRNKLNWGIANQTK